MPHTLAQTDGAANPAFTDTITGFVNGDTQASAVWGTTNLTTRSPNLTCGDVSDYYGDGYAVFG
jgi:hypothetical protein